MVIGYLADGDAPAAAPAHTTPDEDSTTPLVPTGSSPTANDTEPMGPEQPGVAPAPPSAAAAGDTGRPIDYADPVWLDIPGTGIAAAIDPTGPPFGRLEFNPAPRRLDWWLDAETAGPCESGPVFILGHVTDVFADLVDDPTTGDDAGVPAGHGVFVHLVDGTVCVYRVSEFDSALGEPLPDTPARRFVKAEWATHEWANVIEETGSQPVLFLLTSGGTEFEIVDGERHRVHVDVVRADLVEVVLPAWR